MPFEPSMFNPIPKPANSLPNAREGAILTHKQRVLLLAVRQALIIMVGAIENYLGMEQSIVPKRERI